MPPRIANKLKWTLEDIDTERQDIWELVADASESAAEGRSWAEENNEIAAILVFSDVDRRLVEIQKRLNKIERLVTAGLQGEYLKSEEEE